MATAKDLFMTEKQIIDIGIPTLHCYDKLVRLCERLAHDAHDRIVPRFTIIDNGGKLIDSGWFKALERLPVTVEVLVAEQNLGVAASWNFLIRKLRQCIISNDDVIFSRGDIELLLDAAKKEDDAMFVGDEIGGWALFWVNKPNEWLSMGGFDENFYPAYYEDDDAVYRLKIAEAKKVQIHMPGWRHENSSTLHCGSAEYQQAHWQSFAKNGAYYRSKWGGMPKQETFLTPFGK